MQALIFVLFLAHELVWGRVGVAQEVSIRPSFSAYATSIYHGPTRIPTSYRQSVEGWWDDMGKQTSVPQINFAGRFYIGLHSCGASCRYFTLSDLKTGKDSGALEMFSSDEGHPAQTSDKRNYVTELISQPDSYLLVARYQIEADQTHASECREKLFVLEPDLAKLRAISKTERGCLVKPKSHD